MVEVDLLTSYIPVILSVVLSSVFSIIFMWSRKLGKTSDGTLTGSIKLEHVSVGLDNLEERINKSFDKMEVLINQREQESKNSLNKLNDKMDIVTGKLASDIAKIDTRIELNSWRVTKLERNGNGSHGAV